MEKLNYRVGSTPIKHNGYFFTVGEPIALTFDEAQALQSHVSLEPFQLPASPAPVAPETPADAPAAAPKAEASGKAVKSGEKE